MRFIDQLKKSTCILVTQITRDQLVVLLESVNMSTNFEAIKDKVIYAPSELVEWTVDARYVDRYRAWRIDSDLYHCSIRREYEPSQEHTWVLEWRTDRVPIEDEYDEDACFSIVITTPVEKACLPLEHIDPLLTALLQHQIPFIAK